MTFAGVYDRPSLRGEPSAPQVDGGSVWESNPPAAPFEASTLVLKTRRAAGPLALPPPIVRACPLHSGAGYAVEVDNT